MRAIIENMMSSNYVLCTYVYSSSFGNCREKIESFVNFEIFGNMENCQL